MSANGKRIGEVAEIEAKNFKLHET